MASGVTLVTTSCACINCFIEFYLTYDDVEYGRIDLNFKSYYPQSRVSRRVRSLISLLLLRLSLIIFVRRRVEVSRKFFHLGCNLL